MNAVSISKLRKTDPRWVVTAVMAVVVLVVLIVYFNQNTSIPKKSKHGADAQNHPNAVKDKQTIEKNIEQKKMNMPSVEMRNSLVEITPQLKILTEQQEKLHQRQAVLNNQVQQQQVQIKQIQVRLTGINNQLTTQHTQLQTLQRVRKKKSIHKKTLSVKRRKQALPQLILASIDQWGETQTAVFEDAGQLVTLRNGERYRGWQLTSINLDGQSVELINTHKQQLSLSLR
jgi:preprotein translocase subunit SecF